MKQTDLNDLFNAAKNKDTQKMQSLGSKFACELSDEQKQTIEKAMNDPEFLQSVLSGKKAKEILKKLHWED